MAHERKSLKECRALDVVRVRVPGAQAFFDAIVLHDGGTCTLGYNVYSWTGRILEYVHPDNQVDVIGIVALGQHISSD